MDRDTEKKQEKRKLRSLAACSYNGSGQVSKDGMILQTFRVKSK
jgi:hypothetical protein